jgi:methylaspartate ammonia-lyase
MKEHILNALEAHFEAKVLKNQALLQNYLNNPVGIGEHPDIIDECIKITDELASAQDSLEIIKGKKVYARPRKIRHNLS